MKKFVVTILTIAFLALCLLPTFAAAKKKPASPVSGAVCPVSGSSSSAKTTKASCCPGTGKAVSGKAPAGKAAKCPVASTKVQKKSVKQTKALAVAKKKAACCPFSKKIAPKAVKPAKK
ncbi:MAG: hypothetical protein ACYC64_14420 [Armatimonadota bacterium]